jgi:hypothetical protein
MLGAPLSSFDWELRQQLAAKPLAAPERDFLVGLSVGQGLQPSGITVLERLPASRPGGRRTYACRYLRRWRPPATAYPTLVADLTAMLCGTALTDCDLIVEAGPSVKVVVGYLRKHRLPARIRPVEVRGSAEDGYSEGLWRVTKASIIETARQVLQEDRMIFDEGPAPEAQATTPSAQTIYHALWAYPYNKPPAANDAFAARVGADDDLIVAVALACWFGEWCRRTFWIR